MMEHQHPEKYTCPIQPQLVHYKPGISHCNVGISVGNVSYIEEETGGIVWGNSNPK